jgi:hypothetical protein
MRSIRTSPRFVRPLGRGCLASGAAMATNFSRSGPSGALPANGRLSEQVSVNGLHSGQLAGLVHIRGRHVMCEKIGVGGGGDCEKVWIGQGRFHGARGGAASASIPPPGRRGAALPIHAQLRGRERGA